MAFQPALPAAINAWDEPEADNDSSPVPGIHRIRSALLRSPIGVEAQFRKNLLRAFLLKVCAEDCIDARNRRREVKCGCLKLIALSEDDAIRAVEFLFGFGLLTKAEQQTMVKEWIKYSIPLSQGYRRNEPEYKKVFLFPGTSHLICKNALCRIIGYGSGAWLSIVNLAKKNLPPSHGLGGLKSNHTKDEMKLAMTNYLEKIQKLAAPRATLVARNIVRDEVQIELRDDDEELLELPSNMSKRSIYNNLVAECGWKFTYDSRSRIIERTPIEGVEQTDAPSWSGFRQHWKTNFAKLVVAGARQDVCNECYVFANKHRYAKRTRARVEDDDDQHGPQEEDDVNEEAAAKEMEESEKLVRGAALHVEMAQQQRELYRQKKKEAIATIDKRPAEKVLCYVADYAQNLPIPNFASEQPGATYYYSPLSIYCFGVVDASVDRLTAWLYSEAQAAKGGNNVASLLWAQLEHDGVIEQSKTEPFKEINLVMDNCGGQNKNRHVLRLLFFMVKRKITKVAKAIFLVRGHTKNDCDRLFNTMKKDYRKTNSFTPEDVLNSIVAAGNNKVKPVMVPDDGFKDWNALQDVAIKPPLNQTKANHIFYVDAEKDNGNTMWVSRSDGRDVIAMPLVKVGYREEDCTFWTEQEPATIDSVGLQDIKWRELHDKWGTYVPEEKRQQWRYYTEAPPKVMKDAIAKQSKEARKQRKSRTRTVHEKSDQQQAKKPKNDTDGADGKTHGVI
jgi:hypothetical protein